jgi:leucyl-tRNA synthetase
VPVPDEQLPVVLPEVDEHWAGKKTGNPLETLDDWVNTSCPKCSGPAKRDTDTMDTFVDSSWYYMRFIDAHNKDAPFSAEKAKTMLPVDLYIGGIEHAILHLLYARFIYKFLMTSSLMPVDEAQKDKIHEPFKRLITQGMVHGRTYIDPATGKFLKSDEVDLTDPSTPKVVATGATATVTYEKMSKSKHNGVDPTNVITQHGADATRAHMLFQAPVSEILDWDGDKIVGVTRWLGRVHDLVVKIGPAPAGVSETPREYFENNARKTDSMSAREELAQWDADVAVWREVQKTIVSVTASYEKVYALNTVVSDLMSLANVIQENGGKMSELIHRQALSALVRMMAPITPAFAEECWALLGRQQQKPENGSMFKGEGKVNFPVVDGTLEMEVLQPRKQTCAVQVNGKVRAVVEIPTPNGLVGDELREWLVREILKTEEGKARLVNGNVDVSKARKVIVIKGGALVNFVL